MYVFRVILTINIISLNSVSRLISLMDKVFILCEVETEILHKIRMNVSL